MPLTQAQRQHSPERLLLDHALERYITKAGREDVLNYLLTKYPAA